MSRFGEENMEIVIGRICPDNSGFMEFVTETYDSCEIMRFKNCKAALLYLSLSGALQGLSVGQRKEQFKFMDANHVLENITQDGFLIDWNESMFIDYEIGSE